MLVQRENLPRPLVSTLMVFAIAGGCDPSSGALPAPPTQTARALLDQAVEKLMQRNLEGYRATVEQAVAADGTADQHARAVAELANACWRIDKDVASARRVLAPVLGADCPAPLWETARMEMSLENFSAARQAALAALRVSKERKDVLRSRTLFAHAVVGEIFQAVVERGVDTNSLRAVPVREAAGMLAPYVIDEPGMREPSRLALLLALWSDDRLTALRAFESYFRLPPDADLPAPLTAAGQTVRRILSIREEGWTPAIRTQLIDALVDSRMVPEGAVLAALWKVDSNRAREARAYAHWTIPLRRDFNEDYRQFALRQQKVSGSERLARACAPLWRALSGTDAGSSEPRLVEELRVRFGTVIRTLPVAANYGHMIEERFVPIDQYGHKTRLRLIVLDDLVAGSYMDWLTDERAGIGGWSAPVTGTEPPLVVSIRGDAPLRAWEMVTDPDVMRRNRADLERWRTEDDDRAKQNPYAFLPGLQRRMSQAGAQRILDRERARGLTGAALRMAFLAEYACQLESSLIIAHEGRHALDKQAGSWLMAEREYRAKLSEVAFAPNPLIATRSIFTSNISRTGDAHAVANERIMRGIVAWMQTHSAAIHGFEPERPVLPQFDKLTDEQMREAFRSMGPWAREARR